MVNQSASTKNSLLKTHPLYLDLISIHGLKQLFIWLVNLMFPNSCLHCGQGKLILCPKCLNSIPYLTWQIPINFPDHNLDWQQSACSFEKPISTLIHALKYEGIQEISSLLAAIVYKSVSFPPIDLITAVPLHFHRQRNRGFNQSALIGKQLSQFLKVPYKEILVRARDTPKQAQQATKEDRAKNILGAFSCQYKFRQPLKIMVVDDVLTTGATTTEAAKALKQNGASWVGVVTVAREK